MDVGFALCKLHSVAEVCKDDDLSQFELCYSDVPSPPTEASTVLGLLPRGRWQHSQLSARRLAECIYTVFVLPGNELLSLQNKKGRNKSAAVQFVKKDWGKFSRIN